MKYKTTAKAVKAGYYNVIGVGYCDLQSLLNYKTPIAYSCGTYGWNFDVYDINGVAIATGYRGMPSQNSKCSYALIREYEQKAQSCDTKEGKDILIAEFIAKAIK